MTKKSLLIASVLVYFVATGASFAMAQQVLSLQSGVDGGVQPASKFAQLISPLVPKAGQGAAQIAEGAPKTEPCPLNGQMYTKSEREAWETRTPLAVMIENHVDARPQSGLSNADVVFEAVAEGGITRFMAMMYCGAQANDIILAPIRSARSYFIDWASSYQEPIYVHVGGANLPGPANALGQLEDYKWAGRNDFNQFSIGFPTFARNYSRITLAEGKSLATEHTMETSTERLWKYGQTSRKISTWVGKDKFKNWEFKEDATEKGTTARVAYEFWEDYQQFAVEWNYDAASNLYRRNMAGEPHLDLNNGQQIQARNVVLIYTTEKGPIDEAKHMLYGTTGTGKVVVFQDGKMVTGTWQKASRTAPLLFTGSNGKPLALNRGLTWISVISATNKTVEY